MQYDYVISIMQINQQLKAYACTIDIVQVTLDTIPAGVLVNQDTLNPMFDVQI